MKYFLLFLVLLIGCSGLPNYREYKVLYPEITNKFLITLKGQIANYSGKTCTTGSLFAEGVLQKDPYVDMDIAVITSLAPLKGYVVLNAESAQDLYSLVDDISARSNSQTETIITLSGECSISPGELITPEKLFGKVCKIQGKVLLIVSGCQSGVFVNHAKDYGLPNLVVIGACPVGYATTECQKYGTTALMAGIIKLYPTEVTVIDLSTVDIEPGDFIENIRHKISDIFDGGLPISYEAVRYSSTTFKF